MNTVTFDSDLKEKVLSKALNKRINEEGYIVDEHTSQEVLMGLL